ncbi:hypothetical protein BJ546DRAFT_946430 [Cryomyces antarcticus]
MADRVDSTNKRFVMSRRGATSQAWIANDKTQVPAVAGIQAFKTQTSDFTGIRCKYQMGLLDWCSKAGEKEQSSPKEIDCAYVQMPVICNLQSVCGTSTQTNMSQ